MMGENMLARLQGKLRRSGTLLLAVIFCVLGVIVCRQITQMLVQSYDKRFNDGRELLENTILGSNRLDLEQISWFERQYGVFLYLYNREKEIELPYLISAEKEQWRTSAESLVQNCRAAVPEGETYLQTEAELAGTRVSYTMQRLDSGQTAELLILQPKAALYRQIPRSCLTPAAALLAAFLLLVVLYQRWLSRTFAPAYAAQQAQMDFLSLAGHELRTPVTVIRSNAELLAEEQTRGSAGLNNILTETLRMDVLVEDLILFSRMQTKNIRLDLRQVDVCEILLECFERFYPLLESGGRHLLLDPPPDEDVLLQADPVRLGQMMGTLLSNANAHTPPGTTVRLGLRQETDWLELYVQDDGPGIPDDVDCMRRAEGTHLGVGLPIARELAQLQGGTLLWENVHPHGARFAFRFSIKTESR